MDHNILLLFENITLPNMLGNKKYHFVGHCGAFRGLKCVAIEIVILAHLLSHNIYFFLLLVQVFLQDI